MLHVKTGLGVAVGADVGAVGTTVGVAKTWIGGDEDVGLGVGEDVVDAFGVGVKDDVGEGEGVGDGGNKLVGVDFCLSEI